VAGSGIGVTDSAEPKSPADKVNVWGPGVSPSENVIRLESTVLQVLTQDRTFWNRVLLSRVSESEAEEAAKDVRSFVDVRTLRI